MKKKIKILYLFRRPVKKNIKLAAAGLFPHDYFFGYTKLSKIFQKHVSDRVLANKVLIGIELLFQRLMRPFTHVGFSLISVARHFKDISDSDVIFATVDSYGLPLAFLKFLGLVAKPMVIYTGGLCDALVESRSPVFNQFARILIKQAAFVISGLPQECRKMAKILNLPSEKFKFVPYGIDTDYFSPQNKSQIGDYILAVGADPKRDWNLHKKIAAHFPSVQFFFVTDQVLSGMPKNVQLVYNIPISDVRTYMRRCLFVLVLSKQNYRFAGQSTAFRAMSCGKAVILTSSQGVEAYPHLKNYDNCLMVPSNNFPKTSKAINFLLADRQRLRTLGKNARSYIEKYADYRTYTKSLETIFKESLK